MQEFTNKVAVVTGAASGIGKALAAKCLDEGMQVVLADIEEDALAKTTEEFQVGGANNVLPVITNVARKAEIEALAKKAVAEFGGVHLLFNNAGVSAGSNPQDTTYDDWEWVLGVNLWSVIYGVKTFLPILQAQEGECHIVNTASAAGLIHGILAAPYSVTKHGVVALTEGLYFDQHARASNTGVSALCPGFISTNLMNADRNRPIDLPDETAVEQSPEADAKRQMFEQVIRNGLPPAELAEIVFAGIRAKRLYILSGPEFNEIIQQRADQMTAGTNPVPEQMPFQ